MEIANINDAANERLRVVAEVHDEWDQRTVYESANLVWVTRDMTQLAYAMAVSLPEDYEPRQSDFGILPETMMVCFAGEEFIENVWMVNSNPVGQENTVMWATWSAGEDSVTPRTWKMNRGMTLADAPADPGDGWSAFWAFILLSNEKLTRIMHERPNRHVRRRDRNVDTVIVVTLRRLKAAVSQESGEEAHYSHRFWVNSFWRNQWFPKEGRHKPKFIHAYVKGPEDKPFIAKDRIFRVSR